jgi:cytochrome c-type biogenesis protein CcmH/NrfG
MGKRKRLSASAVSEPLSRPAGENPSRSQIALLILIVLVIGLSGGYLAYRFGGMGEESAPPADDAGTRFRGRLLQNPQDVEALLGLAHVHLDRHELDAAEPLYRQVLGLQPKNVEAIVHLGAVALGRGQAEAALSQYDAALAIQPDYVHALWDKAILLQQVKRDYAAAIRTWESFQRAVGPESVDGKTALRFIQEARQAMTTQSPVEKAFGGSR